MIAHPAPPARSRALLEQVRAPWLHYVDGAALTIRGARPQDLPAVALMHRRCSAKSLLDRYRTGGRAPAIIVLDRQVREPMSFVVTTEDGRVVASSRIGADGLHQFGSAEISMLVEDGWQRLGIGRALLRHCAAAAAFAGYRQLISYPGTTATSVQRLMASGRHDPADDRRAAPPAHGAVRPRQPRARHPRQRRGGGAGGAGAGLTCSHGTVSSP